MMVIPSSVTSKLYASAVNLPAASLKPSFSPMVRKIVSWLALEAEVIGRMVFHDDRISTLYVEAKEDSVGGISVSPAVLVVLA